MMPLTPAIRPFAMSSVTAARPMSRPPRNPLNGVNVAAMVSVRVACCYRMMMSERVSSPRETDKALVAAGTTPE
jgi:hypothetical protein